MVDDRAANEQIRFTAPSLTAVKQFVGFTFKG
jgi:hypothetical protein